jgi:hypothetical protein
LQVQFGNFRHYAGLAAFSLREEEVEEEEEGGGG